MYCSKCGTKNEEFARFCKNCGALLSPEQETYIENNPVNKEGNHSKTPKEDSPNVILIVLSLIIPLIGFILYFVWKKDTPKRANTILISSLIGAVINLIICFS
jgi:uncharacterized membrane protein YvbJ